MKQLSLLDLMEPPVAVMIEPVQPMGQVVHGEPDETLVLPRPGNANPLAEIELHRHVDGRWMWSASFGLLDGSGSSYRVGSKWGRFAATRSDALRAAVDELTERLSKREACSSIPKIISWARGLK